MELRKSACSSTKPADLESVVMVYLNPEWHELNWIDLPPELKSNDSDLVLVGISANLVRYKKPVNDPFFSAHKPFVHLANEGHNVTRYDSDLRSPVMGCQQRVRSPCSNMKEKLMHEAASILSCAQRWT